MVRFRFLLVGRGGFEPPKSKTSDLQSDPFGRSGICPYIRCSSYFVVEPVIGLEPTTCWLQISCSANWATPACVVPWGGIEPPTGRFSVCCSTNWATKAFMATQNGLEPSTSSVTGWRSNQLSYWAISHVHSQTVLVYNTLFCDICQANFRTFS